jgi:hypothetical protein
VTEHLDITTDPADAPDTYDTDREDRAEAIEYDAAERAYQEGVPR